MGAAASLRRERPAAADECASVLRAAAAERQAVRFVGAGTKLSWGGAGGPPAVEVSTAGLDRILEHNAGDLTAVLESGVRLADAQARFAEADQMLALDPPGDDATVGGALATADSGPLRARYGGPRDLVLGITVALSDGTVAKAGGKVIKNVAGYDLAKLFTGSFGTLGAIVDVSVRLHPLPPATATAVGRSSDPAAVAAAAVRLSHAPLEHQSLDVGWQDGSGTVLARFAGMAPRSEAEAALRLLEGLESTDIVEDDESLWREQRAAQRSESGTVIRISALQTQLADVLRAASRSGGAVVGRAGLGLLWLRLEDREPAEVAASVRELRRELGSAACPLLDAPPAARELVDPWGVTDDAAIALMRRVKERFDPAGVCNPGIFVGGI